MQLEEKNEEGGEVYTTKINKYDQKTKHNNRDCSIDYITKRDDYN
jgi:hypothetical protein